MLNRQLYYSFLFTIFTLTLGTFGYRWITYNEVSWVDAIYMTIITLSTVGYEEIVDLNNNPHGRIFTMVLILIGMGNLVFFLSSVTSYLTQGHIKSFLKRRNHMKKIKSFKNHYILCGIGRIGRHILSELIYNKKKIVVIDINQDKIDWLYQHKKFSKYSNLITIVGDVNNEELLYRIGIKFANTVICCLDDDRNNLLLTVTIKNINKNCQVHSRLNDINNRVKFYNVGADNVVSPQYIGGLRIASQILRPTVVNFLDDMLRQGLHRIDEFKITKNSWMKGKTLDQINFYKHIGCSPISTKHNDIYDYFPKKNQIIIENNILFFISTPQISRKIIKFINNKPK